MKEYVSTTVTVREEVDVDISLDDLAADLGPEELQYLATKMQASVVIGHASDPGTDRIVEQAYLAAKRVANLPREIADLFWQVHGRAL